MGVIGCCWRYSQMGNVSRSLSYWPWRGGLLGSGMQMRTSVLMSTYGKIKYVYLWRKKLCKRALLQVAGCFFIFSSREPRDPFLDKACVGPDNITFSTLLWELSKPSK